jgi:hypothetical protein
MAKFAINSPTSANRKLLQITCGIFLASFAFAASWAQAAQPAPPRPTPAPCCVITKVESSSAIATAKENATGRNFQFQPMDRSQTGNLQVGQAIYADFVTKMVSLEWGKPCCQIITMSGAAPGQAAPPKTGYDLQKNKKM